MDYLIERSSTGFRGSDKTNIGIISDINPEDDFDVISKKLSEIEKKYRPEGTTVKMIGVEPVFHHNRDMRKDGPVSYEIVCLVHQRDDLVNFKETTNLYKLTKIKRI